MFTESDPNYDEPEFNKYQDALKTYLSAHKVYLLMDLHGSAKTREYAVEIGTAPEPNPIPGMIYEEDPSLHGYKFIAEKIKSIMEKNFEKCDTVCKEVWKNRVFKAGKQNTITKFISKNTSTPCVQLEINGTYRNPKNKPEFEALIKSLIELINLFNSYDWEKDHYCRNGA